MTSKKNSQSAPIIVSNLLEGKLLSTLDLGDDDKCSSCGYIYPFILYPSGKREYLQGSHPYCNGQWEDHLTERIRKRILHGEYKINSLAQSLSTVVFINAKGEISVPPSPDVPCPPGYSAKTLTSLREIEQFSKERESLARQEYEKFHALEEQRWNNYYRAQGEELRAGAMIPVARLNDQGEVVGYDQKRAPSWNEMSDEIKDIIREAEKQFSQYQGYDPGHEFKVGFSVLNYDESTLRRGEY